MCLIVHFMIFNLFIRIKNGTTLVVGQVNLLENLLVVTFNEHLMLQFKVWRFAVTHCPAKLAKRLLYTSNFNLYHTRWLNTSTLTASCANVGGLTQT